MDYMGSTDSRECQILLTYDARLRLRGSNLWGGAGGKALQRRPGSCQAALLRQEHNLGVGRSISILLLWTLLSIHIYGQLIHVNTFRPTHENTLWGSCRIKNSSK